MLAEICKHPWAFAVDPFHLAGNIYYVGNRDVSAHLIDTGRGLILLDTAFPQTVYLLLESVRKLGFQPKDIRFILNIHGHYDHFGGTRALKDLTGAVTCLGAEDVKIITERPELSWAPEYGTVFYEQYDVDRPLQDGDVIELGGTCVECVHSPGHTDGTISFFFETDVDGRKLTAGIHGGPGTNTLTSEYMRRYSVPVERRELFLTTLQRLREFPVDVHLGAHPDQSDTFGKQARKTGASNPFIDADSWPAFLSDIENAAVEHFKRDPV